MIEKEQHMAVIEEIRQTVSGLSNEERTMFDNAIIDMNKLIANYGTLALLAFAYVGATLALEDSNEGQ